MSVSVSTVLMAAHVATHHKSASCSAQRGWGVRYLYSLAATPTTSPFWSTRIALVAVVEVSMPSR